MGAGGGFTLGELAEALGAVLDGDPGRRVTGVAPLETAGPDDISFLTDPRYAAAAGASRAGALLVGPDAGNVPAPTLRCPAPQLALIALLELFHPPTAAAPGVHATAVVAADARVDATAWVAPCRRRIEAGVPARAAQPVSPGPPRYHTRRMTATVRVPRPRATRIPTCAGDRTSR